LLQTLCNPLDCGVRLRQSRMKRLWSLALILAAPLAGCGTLDNPADDDEKMASEVNVNSRYIIENVHVSGNALRVNISDPLRTDLDNVVGSKYDDSKLKTLADRIKKELHVSDVVVKVTRGTEPDHVVVDFEVAKQRDQNFDLSLAKFVYNSKEGWTGDGSATTKVQGNEFTFGLVSDGDSLVDRFAGVRAKFERKSLFGSKRLRLRFEFDDYHEMWNTATLVAAQASNNSSEIYRSRQVFTPEATLVIAAPLEWSFGVSFARLGMPGSVQTGSVQTETGEAGAPKTESSNAVVNTLRYHQRWGSAQDEQEQEASGSYTVTAASNLLETDEVFTRHEVKAHYRYRNGRSTVEVGFLAGVLDGDAPLYERFVLGDSTTLRGWSKFDLDPLGGSHVVHGSVDYRYRVLQVFYDTGAVWDRPEEREQKQSVGVGFKKDSFQLAVAFPMRPGRVDPIFYAGMNF
jgi:outer membrane protein assembly factor BamA